MFCSAGIFAVMLISTVQSLIHPDNAVHQCYCGVPNEGSNRIINGEMAEEGEFPWEVFLYKKKFGDEKILGSGGGSLVSDQHIITAAHIMKEGYEYGIVIGSNKRPEPIIWSDLVKAVNFTRHPLFNGSIITENDIAVLNLAQPIDLACNPYVKPLCLPHHLTSSDLTGKSAIVAGWGRLNDQEKPGSKDLMKLRVDINGRQCQQHLTCNPCLCTDTIDKGASPCNGDSGSPLFTKDRFNNGAATLVGVVHGGGGRVDGVLKCIKPARPAEYVDVQHHMATGWLPDQLGDYNTCPPPPYSTWSP